MASPTMVPVLHFDSTLGAGFIGCLLTAVYVYYCEDLEVSDQSRIQNLPLQNVRRDLCSKFQLLSKLLKRPQSGEIRCEKQPLTY